MSNNDYINKYECRSNPNYDEIAIFVKKFKKIEDVTECIKCNSWEDDADNIYDIWKEIRINY